jgi:hypothetical protein
MDPKGPFIIDPVDNKIWINPGRVGKAKTIPWVHIRQSSYRKCTMYHEVFVQCLNVLPEQCVKCWKVVFRPQYLRDMLNLIPLMDRFAEKYDKCCKLGAEERIYTSGVYGKWGLWGCYFYNDSKEEGLECWENFRQAIESDDSLKHLLDDLDEDDYPARLILKRGCTEFEVGSRFGDSKNWRWTEEAKKWERIIWDTFKDHPAEMEQGQMMRDHVLECWFKHAHHAGDQTLREFNEGTMLFNPIRTYHKDGGKK